MAFFPRPVTSRMLSTPEASASCTPYWMMGLSTSGSISFGCALVAGRNRVPSPAAGAPAWRPLATLESERTMGGRGNMLDPSYIRAHVEDVRAGLRSRGLDVDTAL